MTNKLQEIIDEINEKRPAKLDGRKEPYNDGLSEAVRIISKHLSTSKEEEPPTEYKISDGHKWVIDKTGGGHRESTGLPTPEQQSDKPTKIELFVDNSAKGITTVKHMIQKINEIIDYINNKD